MKLDYIQIGLLIIVASLTLYAIVLIVLILSNNTNK